jgi:hypothetical protein
LNLYSNGDTSGREEDIGFTSTVTMYHRNNPKFIAASSREMFSVRHFHGRVLYNTTGFTANNSRLGADLIGGEFERMH